MLTLSEEAEVLGGETRQDSLSRRTLKVVRDWRYRLLQKKVMRDVADSHFKTRKGVGSNLQNLIQTVRSYSHGKESRVQLISSST